MIVNKNIKSYDELITLATYEERLKYLQTNSKIGATTFASDRIFNQNFYRSTEWKNAKRQVIIRDNGCDLGLKELPIIDSTYYDKKSCKRKKAPSVIVHHINPITMDDIVNKNPCLFDPNNLITCSLRTHNEIHYGNCEKKEIVERRKNDTCPWKHD